mmetsp:Transcript_3641/g.6109  ORF Transcript_3641/g.6109 Transcript_3641/m.6109 type:complete len:253 (-) Transcript_3641:629-1387(-)
MRSTVLLSNGCHSLLGSIIQITGRNEFQTTFIQQFLTQLHIGPLQTNNDRNLEIQLTRCFNNTFGNNITFHDTPKDIHQHSLDFRIGRDDFKRRLDLRGRGTATDIQKVRGRAAVKGNNIHRRHGESGTIDHASNTPVEANVIQIPFTGSDFTWIFLCRIALFKDILLSKGSIVIESNLGIGCQQIAIGIFGQWIDFDHGAILFHKEIVQGSNLISSRLWVTTDGQALDDFLDIGIGQSSDWIDRNLNDFFR